MFSFDCNFIECSSIENYKMNYIGNKFLLARDKYMPEIHLKQPEFTYSACEPFTKNIKKFKNSEKQEIQNIFTEMN